MTHTAPVTPDDLDGAVAATIAAVEHVELDRWNEVVPALGWTGWETIEHVADSLLYYAMQLVPAPPAIEGGYAFEFRSRRDGGPDGALFARRDLGVRGLLRVLHASAGLLGAAARTAPANHRAYHAWGHADAEGFTAMGVVEVVVHSHDLSSTLGVGWDADEGVCARVLHRLFPDVAVDADPRATLVWATGRGDLAGRKRRMEWRWHGEPR